VDVLRRHFPDLKVEFVPDRDVDTIRRRCVSIDKIRSHLGWRPEYSIERGIEKTVATERLESPMKSFQAAAAAWS
jgi:dTDP-D-glucose 4,6-dehydratase